MANGTHLWSLELVIPGIINGCTAYRDDTDRPRGILGQSPSHRTALNIGLQGVTHLFLFFLLRPPSLSHLIPNFTVHAPPFLFFSSLSSFLDCLPVSRSTFLFPLSRSSTLLLRISLFIHSARNVFFLPLSVYRFSLTRTSSRLAHPSASLYTAATPTPPRDLPISPTTSSRTPSAPVSPCRPTHDRCCCSPVHA